MVGIEFPSHNVRVLSPRLITAGHNPIVLSLYAHIQLVVFMECIVGVALYKIVVQVERERCGRCGIFGVSVGIVIMVITCDERRRESVAIATAQLCR